MLMFWNHVLARGATHRRPQVIAVSRVSVAEQPQAARYDWATMAEATKSKRPRSESQKRRDKIRGKARVCIGDASERWRQLKAERNLKTDAELATLLLDRQV